MKIFLFILALAPVLLCAGCASNAEDRNFFETGWLHPGDNEKRLSTE